MPTLADVYSFINSQKRKLSDVATNPIASLQQGLGNANDQARNLNQLTAESAQEGLSYGPKTQELANQVSEAYNPLGMTTWHGSPHVFERFDLKKLGSGEGNQAFGSGMYVAESPEVAKGYAVNVSNADRMNQNRLNPHANAQRLVKLAGDPEYAANDLKFVLESNPDHPQTKLLSDTLKMIESGEYKNPLKNSGNLYKVDLPDTHIRRMLDWDAPIKDQPAVVRNLAKQLGVDKNDLGGDLLAKVGKDEAGRKIMQQAGIRGVKYFDEQSRFKNQGTRNFVVFDPNHLTILERNEQAIK